VVSCSAFRKSKWAIISAFGYSAGNPLGVGVIWLVCALSCLIGLLFFSPHKLDDTKEETKEIMGL